ncbi:aspartyl-phosphate phosphatase Spo0E family protein [Aneurinibacillus tyrosinisolvens]|uniref:aspartyl-phosphate phosphatase Spo0E family protein n=1 Tax=Aneurinibacillus tyrosinisolvens TaxID=1443435 RepID=UPI00063F475C|nr:aspartyl-phosphate phosphatase Spo0E family protein [Aneurinibacillus tyrosinisolvens]
MNQRVELDLVIDKLKKKLANRVAQHDFNFRHPDVLHISQELDSLIVEEMKYRKSGLIYS